MKKEFGERLNEWAAKQDFAKLETKRTYDNPENNKGAIKGCLVLIGLSIISGILIYILYKILWII